MRESKTRSEFEAARAAWEREVRAAARPALARITARQNRTGRIVLSVLALAGLGGCYAFLDHANSTSEDVNSGSSGAYFACQDFVKARLKSPSSAKFPLDLDTAVTTLGTSYIVKSYVDAENGFGAPLRSHYVCEVTTHSGSWRLVSLTGLR